MATVLTYGQNEGGQRWCMVSRVGSSSGLTVANVNLKNWQPILAADMTTIKPPRQVNGTSEDDAKTTQKQEKEITAAIPSLPEPKVSVKYPEFIHFRTRGIIDGTDKGSWDDFWYISNTSNKHMTANLKFFLNLKEEFIVEKLEKQGKFLFTYGIGEVLIENGEGTYMIPGVHYAPEVTLNILSIGLLRQQGFEISSNEDRCTLAYMFKDKRGKDINLDRMREQHNNYLEDYFDALDRSANIKREIEQPRKKENDDEEIGNFHRCVAFLDLIRKRGALNNEWEIHRDKFNRVLTCDFEVTSDDRRIERSDGMNIRRCYLDYLEPLVSNYKAARSSNPTGGYGDEGIRRFDGYHGDGNKDGSMAAKEKGIVKHFGITLEEEEGKYDATAQQDEEDMARIKCYICQRMGHFDSECPSKDQRPTDGASTSRQQVRMDTKLPNLEFLQLRDNKLTGVLPPSISNCSKLGHLEMSSLVGLTTLVLGSNRFRGKVPTTIGKLQKLQSLGLYRNQFLGPIPDAIGNLSFLSELYSDYNKLEGNIPPSLGNCTELNYLYLSYNRLGGKIPKQLLQIPALTILFDLSHNNLYGSVPSEVKDLKMLNILDLSYNNLSGNISIFGECIGVSTLNLRGNISQGIIPLSFSSLRGLEFEGDFEGLAEILGLERSDGMNIRRCYLDYLEPLVSNYKAARSSNPTGGYGDEGIRRFEDYHGEGSRMESMAAKEKGNSHAFRINPPGRGRKILNNLGNNTTMEVFRCADNPFGGEGISRYLGLGKSLTDFILNSGAATYMEASLIPFSTSHS
ncbi:ARID DNA-binding domain-containing protein [Tanacetum coccineum]